MDEHFGPIIKRIDQLFKIRMNQNLQQLDITATQMHVLLHLHCNSGNKITQKDLANHFEVKHSTMAGILSRLSEKNLIEITVDEENKKFKNITLTNKAMEEIELMTSQRDETESILLKGFSSDETTRLRAYLERLYSNLVSGTDISEQDICCLKKEFERRNHD